MQASTWCAYDPASRYLTLLEGNHNAAYLRIDDICIDPCMKDTQLSCMGCAVLIVGRLASYTVMFEFYIKRTNTCMVWGGFLFSKQVITTVARKAFALRGIRDVELVNLKIFP